MQIVLSCLWMPQHRVYGPAGAESKLSEVFGFSAKYYKLILVLIQHIIDVTLSRVGKVLWGFFDRPEQNLPSSAVLNERP